MEKIGEYSFFLKDRKIPICLKRKILDTVILPAMTYGAETWALTKHQEKKLEWPNEALRGQSEICNTESAVHERTVARTCSHQESW